MQRQAEPRFDLVQRQPVGDQIFNRQFAAENQPGGFGFAGR